MNSLFLLITAIVAFVFGYRFYSKLLAGAVFRLDTKYSTAIAKPTARPGENRYFLMGQHIGLVASAVTLSGAALAAYWGWIPAFLWVVLGSALAAGTFGIGSLWLSRFHADESLKQIILHYFRPAFWVALRLLLVLLLMVLMALLTWLSARLLVNHPSAVAPFWIQTLLGTALGVFLARRGDKHIAPASAVALLLLLVLVWLFTALPIGFSGAVYFDLAGSPYLTLDADLAWTVLLVVYLYYARHPGMGQTLRPRAWFASIQFALLLVLLFAGIVVAHPVLVAPGFNPAGTTPSAIPWLLVTVTGGALAGIYLLIAHHFTAPVLRQDADCQQVGYGTAVFEGLAAVSAIIVCSAGFASATEWEQFYASWAARQDPGYLLELYINGFVFFAGYLGIATDFAANLASVILLGISLATLEAAYRLLVLMAFDSDARPGPETGTAWLPRAGLLAVVVILAIGAARTETSALPVLFGTGNLLLAAFGLLLLVAALERHQRPGQLLLGLILLLLPAILWVTGLQLGDWWGQGKWLLVFWSLLLFGFGLWIFAETVQILWKPGEDRDRV